MAMKMTISLSSSKADGTYFLFLDHGRIVESPQYGKVFYVLFMDWEDMHIRYNDKFAR